jgi:UDP-glucose 4-epimerase
MAKILVTGCAGFIGSNLVDRLLADGANVVGIDNFSSGQRRFLEGSLSHPGFRLFENDLRNLDSIVHAFADIDLVFHLSANADIRFGLENPRKDLEQNTLVTFNVLESMRLNGVSRLAFSSTGSVYGEAKVVPTPEDGPFPIQTSLYGASKVACEALIAAYCEGFNFQSWVFRFVSILGERYTHGHVFDFCKRLAEDATVLDVLGDGRQAKSYLYVQDCIDAMILALEKSDEKVNIFNLGVSDTCFVDDSIGWICDELNVKPLLRYTGGSRGWIGDNPLIQLDTRKINDLGWKPRLSIEKSIRKTVRFLVNNPWVFQERD